MEMQCATVLRKCRNCVHQDEIALAGTACDKTLRVWFLRVQEKGSRYVRLRQSNPFCCRNISGLFDGKSHQSGTVILFTFRPRNRNL